jgi:hypothetical protein
VVKARSAAFALSVLIAILVGLMLAARASGTRSSGLRGLGMIALVLFGISLLAMVLVFRGDALPVHGV